MVRSIMRESSVRLTGIASRSRAADKAALSSVKQSVINLITL